MNSDDMNRLGAVSRELQRADKDNLARLARIAPAELPDGARRGRANLLGAGSAGADPVEQVRNYVGDARRIIDNFEKSTIELESKVAQLSAQLDGERAARQSLEKMITEISRLVAPQ